MRKSGKILTTVCAVALLGGALVYYNVFDKVAVGVEKGNKCPDVTVRLYENEGGTFVVSDETFTLSQQIGKVTVLNFWGSTCIGCIEELPAFNQIQVKYGDDVEIVAIAGGDMTDTLDGTAKWMNQKGWKNYDEESDWVDFSISFAYMPQKEAAALGCDALPYTIIVDKSGIVVYASTMQMHYEDLDEIISNTL